MSEVEKMYENAGINKIGIKRCSGIKQGICQHNCNECESFDYKYPPFTVEKQLELIKWLMCNKQTIQVELRLYENDYCISHITECEHNNAVEYVETGRKKALADLVSEMWQDLTEEGRKQIRNILESEVRE